MRLIFAVFAFAFLAGPASADSPSLTGAEVTQLIAGNTIVAVTQLPRFADRKDKTFYLHIRKDGTLKILTFTGDVDTGRWAVTPDGQYCSQYDNTRKGKQSCYQVKKAETEYYLFDVKRKIVSSTFVVKPGNAKGL